MKRFACGDVVPGCTATFTAPDDDGLLGQVAEHARRDHGMADVPADVVESVKQHIISVP